MGVILLAVLVVSALAHRSTDIIEDHDPDPAPRSGREPLSSDQDPGDIDPPTSRASTGLHFTPPEVEIWTDRTIDGPYRHAGDVVAHSPGDWERVVENAEAFLEDASRAHWDGPDDIRSTGCVRADAANDPPRAGPTQLRDAAFLYLITGDKDVRDAVKHVLLEQAGTKKVDFSNRRLWCIGEIIDDHPSFAIANWLTKLLYAYDYLGAGTFSVGEAARLNAWFYAAADYWRIDLNDSLDRLFVDRWNGNYTLTEAGANTAPDQVEESFLGGPAIHPLHRHFNNRRATVARFVGVAAIKLSLERWDAPGTSVEDLRRTSALFAKDWIRFSVFPDGVLGEFHRWSASNPSLGWAYGATVLATVITIADTFARHGDRSIIDFATTQGALGTQSARPKTLLFAMHSIGRYVDGTYARRAPASRLTNAEARIGGTNDGWEGLHDIQIAPANLYYRDAYISDLVHRRGPGMPPYPREPASSGQHLVWAGDWGTYPATLLMFAGLEGTVWPYE